MVEIQVPSSSASADGVAVLHASTGQFLGPALVLVERDAAIAFDSAEVAERFLARHASEPCYHVVALSAHLAA